MTEEKKDQKKTHGKHVPKPSCEHCWHTKTEESVVCCHCGRVIEERTLTIREPAPFTPSFPNIPLGPVNPPWTNPPNIIFGPGTCYTGKEFRLHSSGGSG